MIPQKIHYCWFGHNPKPKLAKKCIKSWKKYCPNFEIIEWNEDNFDISASPLYVRQAYEAKKWAFVTDYVRLWAMTQFGGVYMDTDVELIQPLDNFLNHEAFSGFEDGTQILTGIMACQQGFPLFEEFLHYYDYISFLNPDGTMNCTTNVKIMTDICCQHGLVQNGEYQCIEGFAIYPKDVFCPINYHTGYLEKSVHTVAIHWFAGSWQSEEVHKQRERRRRKETLHFITHFPNRLARSWLGNERYEKLKIKLKRNHTRK